jgi:signal transduction histidine kinase
VDVSISGRERRRPTVLPRRVQDTIGDDEDTVPVALAPRVIGRAVGRAKAPRTCRTAGSAATGGAPAEPVERRRQELRHDIRHQLATVMLLASLLESATDVGPQSRERARQILRETRWLDTLHRAYEESFGGRGEPGGAVGAAGGEPIRLDLLAAGIVEAARSVTSTEIAFSADVAWVQADALAAWRALRNTVDNAVRAAGPTGRVSVRVGDAAGWVVAQVDDDGPGFGSVPASPDTLGLAILRDVVAGWGGYLEIGRGELGGCRVVMGVRPARTGEDRAVGNL